MNRAAVLLALALPLHGQQPQIGRPPVYSKVLPPASNSSFPIKLTSGSPWLDTSTRNTVLNSFLNVYLPSTSVPLGWVGNVAGGVAGSTSQAYQDAVLLRINWFRQMAGIASSVAFWPAYNTEDQQAALMMSANGQLNHNPPSTWTYFTAPGADGAAHSNLCLEIPYIPDPGCIWQYMQDYGASNPEVGHRRWLLYPQTQLMGTGDVQPPYPTPFANAIWVVDSHFQDARPATRDPFIAWPPRGYVPYQVVPGRWSFSYPGADFTNSTVTMQRSGSTAVVRLETPLQGYGENSVVWVPDNIDTSVSTSWPKPLLDTPVIITVAHVVVAGVDSTFTYTVTVFDPLNTLTISGHVTQATSPLVGVSVSLTGGLTTTTDSTGLYQFGPLAPGAYLVTPSLSGYAMSPSSRAVSATSTTSNFSATACDYSAIVGTLPGWPQGSTDSVSSIIPSGCPWTAVSNTSWLTISPSTTSGIGPVNVTYTYPANHNAARNGTISIAGRTLTVAQTSAGQNLTGPFKVGVFYGGKWIQDTNGNGVFDAADKYFTFQLYGASDTPLIGDWNGDGHSKVGVYAGGFWALDYNGNGQFDGVVTDRFYSFGGNPGEIPLIGDWNGDGRSKIGTYWKGFWALDYNGNGVWDGPVIDRFYAFAGNPGETPVIGDWNGDGRAKIGTYLNGMWQLDYNGNGQWDGGTLDRYTSFTIGAGDKPVVGDWSGSGTAKIGVYKGGFWALDTNGNGVYDGGIDQFVAFGGNPSETPIVGDWSGDGKTKVGYYYNGFWALDYNGNGRYDGIGLGQDRFTALGGNPGEKPALGKW